MWMESTPLPVYLSFDRLDSLNAQALSQSPLQHTYRLLHQSNLLFLLRELLKHMFQGHLYPSNSRAS